MIEYKRGVGAMQKELAEKIISGLLKAHEKRLLQLELQVIFTDKDKIERFHPWANNKKHVGVIKISPYQEESFYLAFIDWQKKNNYYVVIFGSNRAKPLAELHKVQVEADGSNLCWIYKPTKRDKKNNLRKDYFTRCFGGTEVRVRIPEDIGEVYEFLQDLITLVKNKVNAEQLIPYINYREGFPEGRTIERVHRLKERSSKVTELAKQHAKDRLGKVVCEVCDFDFGEYYGDLGVDFIEAHHTIPVSELKAGHTTRVEEIALVCCNCHQMLHRRRPWLKISDLKNILNAQER